MWNPRGLWATIASGSLQAGVIAKWGVKVQLVSSTQWKQHAHGISLRRKPEIKWRNSNDDWEKKLDRGHS